MHPRSEVAARFWPDVLDSSARKSLRTELVAVRHALGAAGDGVLVATRDTVGLVGDGVCVDAREFERLVREGRLQEAVELGDGELLAGLDEEWVYDGARVAPPPPRRRARAPGRARGGGRRAGGRRSRLSRRRVELDPLREDAQRELIRRLIAAGELSAARVAFDDLARRLRAELRVPPSRETRRLLDDIHGHARRSAGRPPSAPPLPAALARPVRSPFVGREDAARLAPRPSGRKLRVGSGRLAVIAGQPGNRQDAAGRASSAAPC